MITKIKSRFLAIILAFATILGIFPVTPAYAASSNTGGYAMSGANQTVYLDEACTTVYGSVNNYEGLTVLYISGNVAKVNYSTSSNANGKTGYIKNPVFRINNISTTCVGTVSSSATVYGGPQINSALSLGSVSSGEIVSVIYSESAWYYIEYNTTSGRKRGYVQAQYVSTDYTSRLSGFPQTRFSPILGYTAPAQAVYGGPSDEYATIGSLSNGDWVTVYTTVDNGMDVWYYIGYTISGGIPKFGYVLNHS